MKPTLLQGKVESVRIGDNSLSLVTRSVRRIQLLKDCGVKGDLHRGTRLLDSREDDLLAFGFPKGMEIANYRQVSVASSEELLLIEQALHLPGSLPFGYLGENLVLSGIPRLSQLPPSTKILFRKSDGTFRTAVIVVWAENGPCIAPGQAIQSIFTDVSGIAQRFPKAAIGIRGIVGSVYVSGFVEQGDTAVVLLPEQRIYSPG